MRNDPSRLAKLRSLMILDSGREVAYDDITRTLAAEFSVPIAMVNLLDAERDWFKSCIGLPFDESPSATSFCEVFFAEPGEVVVVEDTLADPRFNDHPLVIGEPHIRFYASARLRVDGQTVGTLCVYDVTPKSVSEVQADRLKALALAAMQVLRQRRPDETK